MSERLGPDAHEIAGMLCADLERLAEHVLPDGRREGREWRGTGPDGGVWSVVLHGSKRGLFANWGDPERQAGDPLELVSWGICRGDRKAAFAWAKQWLGIGAPGAAPRPAFGPAPSDDRRRRAQEALEAEAKRRRAALALWLEAVRIPGTPAEAYLAGRGLELQLFDGGVHALRYHPACRHPVTQTEMPCMLACVIDPRAGVHLSTHRTFLERIDGTWRKASVRPAKMALGGLAGGIIPLLYGASGKRWRDAPEGDPLLIAEGIENALSAGIMRPTHRAIAAVSVGNIAAINLPPRFFDILLVQDRDGENDAVHQAHMRAISRWLDEGRGTAFLKPPGGISDVNEWWQQLLHEEGEGRAIA